MTYDQLIKLVRGRPWRGLEVVLVSGEKFHIVHPEHVMLTEELVVVFDEGSNPAWFEPEAVASVQLARNGARRKG